MPFDHFDAELAVEEMDVDPADAVSAEDWQEALDWAAFDTYHDDMPDVRDLAVSSRSYASDSMKFGEWS